MAPPALIGITTYGRDQEEGFCLPGPYVDAVRRAGGRPILLVHGDAYEEEFLELLDGVVLSGGGDLDPDLYGGEHHPTIYMIDQERDRTELDLARSRCTTRPARPVHLPRPAGAQCGPGR